MSKRGTQRALRGIRFIALAAAVAAGFGIAAVQAQDVKIQTRPLTAQEIDELGLPLSTQIGGGVHNVGIGQPAYLEVLVEQGAGATNVEWSIDGVRNPFDEPISSTATFMPSPIPLSTPPYDGGDAADYDVADRVILVPEKRATYDISAAVSFANGTVAVQSIVVGSIFLGKDHYLCVLCHADKMDNFNETGHATAFIEQINGEGSSHFNPNCISCHTLGYDATPGADNGGFDDVAADTGWTFPGTLSPTNYAAMPTALQEKANVQCENCHGPADEHVRSLGDTDRVGVTLSAGNCGQCHDRLGFHVKNSEWATAAHSQGYVFRDSGSCAPCHSSIGFIDAHDPDYVGAEMPRGTGNEGLGCATCHDPHEKSGLPHQLRSFASATLENDTVVTEGGAGLVCMNCHRARTDAEDHVMSYNSRFGPHHGPQADMVAGDNAVEYGINLPSSRHLQAVEDSCAGCHMQNLEGTEFAAYLGSAGGHTWKMSFDNDTPEDPTDDVPITVSCRACHGAIEDFDFGGEDYDFDGIVEGVQTEIRDMLDELAHLLPPVGSPDVEVEPDYTEAERKAAYNFLFVEEDRSLGVHNPKYAANLLRASIDDLKGGIDIDRDGLIDSWEIAQFGNLTSQSGQDDFDGDGINNETEFGLSTNPKAGDSDGDGFSDLAEVQGFSDPTDPLSVPDANLIVMEQAIELGYLPTNVGASVQFQAIDALTGGAGWQDVGPEFLSTGEWLFQLESMRMASNRFYRVMEQP